jgi:hypothetical protein
LSGDWGGRRQRAEVTITYAQSIIFSPQRSRVIFEEKFLPVQAGVIDKSPVTLNQDTC